MEWTNVHDIMLCREIMVIEPYTAKPRRTQRGPLWKSIADNLNSLAEPKFNVTQRAVRDRFKLIGEKFKKKIAAEERASGIDPEMSELDILLEDILAKEESSNEEHLGDMAERKKKEETDKENAEDMRFKAMENLRETQKRKEDCGGKERNVKRRSKGSEAVQYLRDRMERDNRLKEQELELKKRDVEKDERRQSLEDTKHNDMVNMMQLQQQQMQRMQMSFVQAQQQQNTLFMALIEKLSK